MRLPRQLVGETAGGAVLQPRQLPPDGKFVPFVSDFLDFSIYIDADVEDLRDWYLTRFFRLRETAFRDPSSFFRKFAEMSRDEAGAFGRQVWRSINLPNLVENILPTKGRADLILKKGKDHRVDEVKLKRL